jgi:hypothetical protein
MIKKEDDKTQEWRTRKKKSHQNHIKITSKSHMKQMKKRNNIKISIGEDKKKKIIKINNDEDEKMKDDQNYQRRR